MKPRSPTFQDLPLKMVGSSVYGRYPKISVERTFNMIVSDNWLVDYAGFFQAIAPIVALGAGRGIYHSSRLNLMFVAAYSGVYVITPNLTVTQIGTLNTFTGDVFFAEDIQGHIAICDKVNIWIYTRSAGTFALAVESTSGMGTPLDFIPGYVAFHDGRFISVDTRQQANVTGQWCLSDPSQGNSVFPNTPQFRGTFQTKADIPVAVLPFPGKANLIFVMGSIVTEMWIDVGGQLFPYQRAAGVNIDYGCLNPDTIAIMDDMACWMGINERAGVVILVSTGGVPEHISTDGIDFRLANLTAPTDCHGFMFKQDGHIIYQVVFPTDNFSFIYDFNTKMFFDVTDTYMNYHPAKRIAFFNNTFYFVSLQDTAIYQMSTQFTTYNGNEIPRVRVCDTTRLPNTNPFVVNNLSFPIEQGIANDEFSTSTPNTFTFLNGNTFTLLNSNTFNLLSETTTITTTYPVVDFAFSNDGGYQYTRFDRMTLNPQGIRRNRFIYYNCSWTNEFTPQFRFFSQGRFVVGNGILSIYQ